MKMKLRKRFFVVVVIVAAIVALYHFKAKASDCLPSPYTYNANVIRVIDGDTVVATFDLGFDINITRKIRLLNIDAPERYGHTRTAGDRSKLHLARLIKGGDVVVVTQNREDSFGRVLGEIYKDGVNLNNQMVRDGQAKAYSRKKR
jgi:micrococcal nuclease